MIPFIGLRQQHEHLMKQYFRQLQDLFSACDFIGSTAKPVAAFEKDFAEYIGCKHAISVASGTDALLLALDALGIRHGDEVILPVFGFIATADVIIRLGGKPVFVDVDPVTFNIDPKLIEAAITPRTKAIIPVHLYGQSCDMAAIGEIAQRHNLAVVEDVAQACGTEYRGQMTGGIGTFGAFSFYPTKNLGAAGDAGMITTNDDDLAEKIFRFRDHGRSSGGDFEIIGYNSRLDTIQALYLHLKLPELSDMILDRIENAKLYGQLFQGSEVIAPAVPEDLSHSFNLYTIKVRDRARLQAYLKEKQIQSAIYYPHPMHETAALKHLGYGSGDFPKAQEVARQCLSLPVWPGLKKREIERVAEVVIQFLENNVSIELTRR